MNYHRQKCTYQFTEDPFDRNAHGFGKIHQ